MDLHCEAPECNIIIKLCCESFEFVNFNCLAMFSWNIYIYIYTVNRFIKIFSTVQELRVEVENLASRVLYMQEAKEDVRSDISVMKRAAEKAHGEVALAEQSKKKQVSIMIVLRGTSV